MEIRLTRDYRGKETKEAYYLKGSVIAMRNDFAARLLELGFAVPVSGNEERLAYPGLEDGSGQRPSNLVDMPEADAIVAADNAKILEAMKAEQAQAPKPQEVQWDTVKDGRFEPTDYAAPFGERIVAHQKVEPKRKKK